MPDRCPIKASPLPVRGLPRATRLSCNGGGTSWRNAAQRSGELANERFPPRRSRPQVHEVISSVSGLLGRCRRNVGKIVRTYKNSGVRAAVARGSRGRPCAMVAGLVIGRAARRDAASGRCRRQGAELAKDAGAQVDWWIYSGLRGGGGPVWVPGWAASFVGMRRERRSRRTVVEIRIATIGLRHHRGMNAGRPPNLRGVAAGGGAGLARDRCGRHDGGHADPRADGIGGSVRCEPWRISLLLM